MHGMSNKSKIQACWSHGIYSWLVEQVVDNPAFREKKFDIGGQNREIKYLRGVHGCYHRTFFISYTQFCSLCCTLISKITYIMCVIFYITHLQHLNESYVCCIHPFLFQKWKWSKYLKTLVWWQFKYEYSWLTDQSTTFASNRKWVYSVLK